MATVTVVAKVLTGLVLLMHVTAMLYLAMLTTLLQTAPATDLVTIKVYKPQVTSALYAAGAALHLYTLCSMAWTSRRAQEVGPTADEVPAPRGRLRRWIDSWYDHGIIVFNLVETASECYQAHAMFKSLVEPSKVISYAAIVVVNCFGSPLLLYVRNTTAKVFLINVADAVVSFTLSCGHPLVAVALQLVQYVLVDPNLGRDSLWSTQTMLLTRLLVPSNIQHLVAMLALHVGTYLALRRVLDTAHPIRVTLTKVFIHADAASSRSRSAFSQNAGQHSKPERLSSIEQLIKLTRQKRMLIHFNLVFNVVLGITSIVVITRSVVHRTPCPPYCPAIARPLFDLTCNCALISINCVAQGIQDPLPLLDPAIVGTTAIYLELHRCDLASGIPASSLAPFQELSKVMIIFSNMSSWDGPVPPALNHVIVRYSQLQSVPRALVEPMSPALVAIYLDHCDLREIPDPVLQAWTHIKRLTLINANLTEFPNGLVNLVGLEMLNIQGNKIPTLPSLWLDDDGSDAQAWPKPKKVYLGGNELEQVPTSLINQGGFVDLSGNPIPTIPAADSIQTGAASRKVILDATPHCTTLPAPPYCQPICAPRCFDVMLGDFNCDLECFVPSCGLDLGDCDAFGFTGEP